MNEDSAFYPILNEILRPIEELGWVFINVFWGNESTFEDIILLIGTMVAFVAFILWCCFPVIPKDGGKTAQYYNNHHYKDCNSDERYNQIEFTNGTLNKK
ncbi:hypothetical protein ABEB36_010656 [Hypothenemus hampei]|uniref:Uncharacterized protein n=1 Tax=Hypothenemus hampei TaxID=57062 RepID=A0ABD1ECS2_HYPHA